MFQLPSNLELFKLTKRTSASILLITKGCAYIKDMMVKPGVALFLPANEVLIVRNITENVVLFQAFVNIL